MLNHPKKKNYQVPATKIAQTPNPIGLQRMTTTEEAATADRALHPHKATPGLTQLDVGQSETPQQEAKTQEDLGESRDEITPKTQKRDPARRVRNSEGEQGWVSHWIGTTPVWHKPTPLQRPNQRTLQRHPPRGSKIRMRTVHSPRLLQRAHKFMWIDTEWT